MTTIVIFSQLNFVYCQAFDGNVGGHGFDSTNPIARFVWDDPLFPCDQSDRTLAFRRDHAVIDLTCKQAQGQSYHTGRVAHHAIERVMGLARIGRAENGFENGHEKGLSGRRFDRNLGFWTRLGLIYVCIDQVSIGIFSFKLSEPITVSG